MTDPHMPHAQTSWSLCYFENFLGSPQSRTLKIVYVLQKQAVCVLVTRVFGNMMAEVPVVSTKESARRQGHARRLMQALEELLKKVSFGNLTLIS